MTGKQNSTTLPGVLPLLAVRDLHKSFGGVKAVDGVGFDLAAGELLALIGPNGAGKSTLFNMVGGQLRADGGAIRLDGRDLAGLPPRRIWRLGVGRTFQIAETFGSLTVAENVQMALLSHDGRIFRPWQRADDYRRADALALLEQVGMAAQAARACGELAYGDVKRVELAAAIAHGPRLLLMDEPTAGMASDERHALMELTRRLVRERGMAVLFTEHSMDVVFGYADRVLVLARGRVIAEGAPGEIRDHPRVREVYLGSGLDAGNEMKSQVFRRHSREGGNPCGLGSQVAPMDSRLRGNDEEKKSGDDEERHGNDEGKAEPLLQITRLRAWHGAAQTLFDVDLHVRRGEVVALMGRNGAGKSTTLKAIMGMVRRRGGVRFMGHDLAHADPHECARLGLGYVPEERRIFTGLTVLENLEAGRQPPRRWPDGSPVPAWTPARLFDLFPNLREMQHRLGSQMSGGEQQMLAVARTLMGNPCLVLLDEPSEGVAPLIVEQMARAILELKAQGVGILLSEQNLPFAQWVSDRAYTLEKGQIGFAGAMAELAALEN